MNTTEFLTHIKEWYLEDPSRWIQLKFHEYDEHGNAVKACLIGSLSQVNPNRVPLENNVVDCLHRAIKQRAVQPYDRPPYSTIAKWNDTFGRTVEEVIDLLDDAIYLSKGLTPDPAT